MAQDQYLFRNVAAAPLDLGLRDGDSGLGLPDPTPRQSRRLKVEETEAYLTRCEAEDRAQFDKKLAELEAAASSFEIPAGIRSFAGKALLLVGCLMGLFLVTQIAHGVADIAKLPTSMQWVLGMALAAVGSVVLYFTGRILWMYVRLQHHKQINIKALSIIAERRHMQAIAEEKSSQARKAFVTYLRDYPLTKWGPEKCKAMGIEAGDFEQLRATRLRLLDGAYGHTSRQWLEDFGTNFQAILDKAAESRVGAYAMKAGLATSTSPNALLDQMIIIYSCTGMVHDLMKLYNLRPAVGQTGAILVQAILHAYLSGVLDSVTETATNSLGDTLGHMAGMTATLPVAKFVSARLAEGTLNGLLVRRLGRQTIRLLQPVRK